MQKSLRTTCAESAMRAAITAFDKLRSALKQTEQPEEIAALTAAVSELVRALYMQDAAKPLPTGNCPAPCEDGRADDMT